MIKNVIHAIFTYTMAIFKVPLGVCMALDRSIKKFYWSSNSNKLKVDDLCNPKNLEALGFLIRINDMNLGDCPPSYLGKW